MLYACVFMCVTDLAMFVRCRIYRESREDQIYGNYLSQLWPSLPHDLLNFALNAALPYFERMRHIGQFLLLPLTRCECHELIIRCLTTIYVQYSTVSVHCTVQLSSV